MASEINQQKNEYFFIFAIQQKDVILHMAFANAGGSSLQFVITVSYLKGFVLRE
ncbi:MAG TPA: hypothetical protein VJJ02_02280 [Candidatus Paceibacterota bacterium]